MIITCTMGIADYLVCNYHAVWINQCALNAHSANAVSMRIRGASLILHVVSCIGTADGVLYTEVSHFRGDFEGSTVLQYSSTPHWRNSMPHWRIAQTFPSDIKAQTRKLPYSAKFSRYNIFVDWP